MARTAGEQPVDLTHRRVELGKSRMGEGGSLVQRRRLPIPSRFFDDQQGLPLDRLPPCHARRHKGVADRIGAAPTDPERPGDLIEPEWRKTSEQIGRASCRERVCKYV